MNMGMHSVEKSIYLYILNTTDEPNNVILGHASFAKEAGFIPVFIFPYRKNSENNENYYSEYKSIRLNYVFKNSNSYEYLVSILKLIIYTTKSLLFRSDVKHILAVDLTGTLACLILKIRGAKVYTLVNDNFSARYAIAPYAFRMLRFVEAVSYKFLSASCIFPDQSRYELLGSPKIKSLKIIPNILQDSFAPKYLGSQSNKLIILFCGWLVKSRGIELISEILEKTDSNVEILLVGSGDSLLINELVKSQRVTYFETVARQEMLEIMSRIDINFAFYNPTILINRFALPQKVYDSLLVGCPIFINSEVEMSKDLKRNGACITANYFDVSAISSKLNSLLVKKNSLLEISASIATYRATIANFDQVKRSAVELYKSFLEMPK